MDLMAVHLYLFSFFLRDHSFASDNGSNPAAKKMMIVVSDGEITEFDRTNLKPALKMLEKMDVTRFAIGVSDILGIC